MLVGDPWLVALGWAVILSLWSTTVAALGLAAWRLLRPAAVAQAQYRAALNALGAAFVLAVLVPALLLAIPAFGDSTAAVASVAVDPASPSVTPQVSRGQAERERSATSADRVAWMLPRVSPTALGFAGGVWVLGSVTLLGRLLTGWLAANRLRRRATLMDEGPLRDTFERLSADAHVRQVTLVVSSEIDAPVALGVRAPAVLVPAHLLDYMPDQSLAPILAHELAHVARRDYAVHLGQSVVEALLFHSPATWWIGRRIREAREFCCDDISVDVAGNRAQYVEALTLVARLGTLTTTRPAVAMAGPRLITRVRRLLEGEAPMSMPLVRTVLIAAVTAVMAAAFPTIFTAASRHVSTQLLAAGTAQQGTGVPLGFPQRQEGSAVRIVRVSSTDSHVCGTFEVQNMATVAVAQVRFVGVLSFTPRAERPVQIVESEWLASHIPPGATVTLDARVVALEEARREARGEHVQVHCALREVVYENRVAWGVTPNPSATTDVEALGGRWPTLPRSLVGQTRAAAYPRTTLCLDDAGAEYSPGAQIAVRDEPGNAARCTPEGQWVEVHRGTGEPKTSGDSAAVIVALEIAIDGVTPTFELKSAAGAVATVQVTGSRTWGFVPAVVGDGSVEIALHDMSATPHRLVGTRTLQPGLTVRFDDVEPSMSVRLKPQ